MSTQDPSTPDEQSPPPLAQGEPTQPADDPNAGSGPPYSYPPPGSAVPPSYAAPSEPNPQAGGYDSVGGYSQPGAYYQSPYEQASPYGQTYYAQGASYPTAPGRTDDKAVWALVTSLVGFVLCPILLHIVGWVLANQSLTTIRASGGTIGGEGIAKAARILSIVGIVLYVVIGLFLALFLVIGLIAAATSGELAQTGTAFNA